MSICLLYTAPPTTSIYPLSLHDALPISVAPRRFFGSAGLDGRLVRRVCGVSGADCDGPAEACAFSTRGFREKFPKPPAPRARSEEHTSELQSRFDLVCRLLLEKKKSVFA